MIDKKALEDFIVSDLSGTDYFLVDLAISANNEIAVTIDCTGNADLEKCIELTRAIEGAFSRDDEDYELEVGTAGLTAPFKVRGQYEKNIGNDVEVLTSDGKKLRGVLRNVDEETFTVVSTEKVTKEGEKRPVLQEVEHTFPYDGVKRVVYDLKF